MSTLQSEERAPNTATDAQSAVEGIMAQYEGNQRVISNMLQNLQQLQAAAQALDEADGEEAELNGADSPLPPRVETPSLTASAQAAPGIKHTQPTKSALFTKAKANAPPQVDYHMLRQVMAEQQAFVDEEQKGVNYHRYGPRWFISVRFWRAYLRSTIAVWLPIVAVVYFNRNAIYFMFRMIFEG